MNYTLVHHEDKSWTRPFEKKVAEGILTRAERKKKPTWVIPVGADFEFKDGQLVPRKLSAAEKKKEVDTAKKAYDEAKARSEGDDRKPVEK